MATQSIVCGTTSHPASVMLIATNGQHAKARGPHKCRATQLTPAWDRLIPGEPVSLDIEFQNYQHTSWEKWRHRVGRVAIVNSKGDTVLDVYAAYPREDGVSKLVPPPRFLVSHQDLKFDNGAVPAHKVERWVKQILKDRTVILHGGKHDLTAFMIEKDVYANSRVVDTQMLYSYLQWDGTPGLRTVAAAILGESVQELVHSPVEDAQTALKLWLLKNTYDREAELAKFHAQSYRAKHAYRDSPGIKLSKTEDSHAGRYQEETAKLASACPLGMAKPTGRVLAIHDEAEFPPLGKRTESKGTQRKGNRALFTTGGALLDV